MTWTDEATALLNSAPEGVRGVARTAIHRYAMERGHSVISRKIIEQAMAPILPRAAMLAMGIIAEEVAVKKINEHEGETYICKECGYAARDILPAACPVCESGPEKFQRIDKTAIEKLTPLEGEVVEEVTFDDLRLLWTSDAKQSLRQVPSGYQRRRAKAQIEKTARVRKLPTITQELVREVAGEVMEATENLEERGRLSKTGETPTQNLRQGGEFSWTEEAWARLQRVPEGFMRDGTKKRMENCARQRNTTLITLEIAEEGIKEGLKAMEEMIAKQAREKGGEKETENR